MSTQDLTADGESLETLRERLGAMKRLMADRPQHPKRNDATQSIIYKASKNVGIIDGNFLSLALMGVLVVIFSVSAYAFYTLYHAVLKKFPSRHTEL